MLTGERYWLLRHLRAQPEPSVSAVLSGRGARRLTRRLSIVAAALAIVGSGLTGCAEGPPMPLAKVDMERMYGGWYIVGTIRNSFEKGMVAPYEFYSKRPDGGIAEAFDVRWGGFDSPIRHLTTHDWIEPGSDNAHWHVIWPFGFSFLVLYTDPDYRYALFGVQNRSLGWIFSRTQTISDGNYNEMIGRFQKLGYDTADFVKVIQLPEQIGHPGYWSDGIR